MKTSYFSTIQLHLSTVENFVSLVSLSSQVFINRLAYSFSYGEKNRKTNKTYTRQEVERSGKSVFRYIFTVNNRW